MVKNFTFRTSTFSVLSYQTHTEEEKKKVLNLFKPFQDNYLNDERYLLLVLYYIVNESQIVAFFLFINILSNI